MLLSFRPNKPETVLDFDHTKNVLQTVAVVFRLDTLLSSLPARKSHIQSLDT